MIPTPIPISRKPLKMSDDFKSSRFLIWDRPLAYPKFDIITRDTDPGPVFDLGVELDSYDGSLYIKPEHIVEMGRTLGMMTKADADKLREENKELRRQINKLPVVQEELKDGLDTLVAKFFASLNSSDPEPDGNSNSATPDNRKSKEAEPDPIKPFDF